MKDKKRTGETDGELSEEIQLALYKLGLFIESSTKKRAQDMSEDDLLMVQATQASRDLRYFASHISGMAKANNKRFFIFLGRLLSGEIKQKTWDRLDRHLWAVLRRNPSITAKRAVMELRKHGWEMSEENFRMRKKRLRFAELLRLLKEE